MIHRWSPHAPSPRTGFNIGPRELIVAWAGRFWVYVRRWDIACAVYRKGEAKILWWWRDPAKRKAA